MTKKRGAAEGSIHYRADKKLWCGQVHLGYNTTTGKRRRKTIYRKTRKEVAEELKTLLRDQQQGMPIALDRQTIEQFLTRWLTDTIKPNQRPKTLRLYTQIVRLYIIPAIGTVELTKLTPQHVQSMLNAMRNLNYSVHTVRRVRDVLRNALNQALRWEVVQRNVATLIDVPRGPVATPVPLTREQAGIFLEAARGDRLEALYRVALSVGLRQTEALGLRWSDLDLDARTLHVAVALQRVDGTLTLVEPKTEKSVRTVSLPVGLVHALREHKVRQFEDQILAGSAWVETGLVFTARTGRPLIARNVVRDFKKLLKRAGLPDIRFHDLRHSCASLLAAQGVSARVAMEILGHSDIRTTQTIYTHIYDEDKLAAANLMDDLLREVGS